MTEREADGIMARIAQWESTSFIEGSRVMLDHLTELYRLRDFYLWGRCSRLMYDRGWEAEHVDRLAKMR